MTFVERRSIGENGRVLNRRGKFNVAVVIKSQKSLSIVIWSAKQCLQVSIFTL